MTQELDCSPAAAMMIERMQTHPEDFLYGGKLHHMSENVDLSKRDRQALNEAHDKYIKEPELMVWLLETLMKPEEDEKLKYKASGRYAIGLGQNDPRLLYGAPIKGEGQAVDYAYNTDTYTTASKVRITREMLEQGLI